MSSLIAQIADAVVTELNDGQFGQEFTADRKWLVRWKLHDLQSLRVTVVPGPASYEKLDRCRDDQRHEMDIAVQKKIDPDKNTQVDELVGLMEEFIAHFRVKSLTAGGKAITCIQRALIPGSNAAVAKEHLEDMRTFTGVLRTTWLVRQ